MHRTLLARTLRGIEDVAADEIRALGARDVTLGHREVRFAAAPEDALRLRTVDDVLDVLLDVQPVGPHRTGLRTLAALAASLDVRADDVTASFLGRRNYSRFEIEETVAAAVRGGPPVSLRVHLTDERTTFAARLAPAPLHRRAYRVVSRPFALHPPLAAALVRLAAPPGGATLGDPFCGTGTIAIEAKLARPDLRVVASDADPEALRATAANARTAGVVLELGGGAKADVVVTNPPWAEPVLWSPAGRAVVLLDERREPPRGATVLERRWVRVRGRPAVCWTLEGRR
ncbi:MAG TPA: hypothetical protein VFB25_03585 [Gaiellaceae bacterium]|nr:hypothetical protein [Gaiellaceae bacterium]